MAIKYSEKVIDHFTQPRNVGDIPDADAMSTEGSPACGDMITYSLKIDPVSKVIEDIRFRSFGCASNIATASIATMLAKGRTIEEVKQLKHADVTRALDGLPAIKLHCSVLAVDGLKSAVHRWEVDNGFIDEEMPKLDRQTVMESLEHIINPRTGVGLVDGKLIKRVLIEQDEGRVFIEVLLCDLDERFAQAIEGEVHEKVGELPGVRKVLVQFTPCEHVGVK